LGVSCGTCNAAVHLELGTLPLKYLVQLALIKFVARMKNDQNNQAHYKTLEQLLQHKCRWTQRYKESTDQADVVAELKLPQDQWNYEYTLR